MLEQLVPLRPWPTLLPWTPPPVAIMHDQENMFSAHNSTEREPTSKLLNQCEKILHLLPILITWKSRSTYIGDILLDELLHHSKVGFRYNLLLGNLLPNRSSEPRIFSFPIEGQDK